MPATEQQLHWYMCLVLKDRMENISKMCLSIQSIKRLLCKECMKYRFSFIDNGAASETDFLKDWIILASLLKLLLQIISLITWVVLINSEILPILKKISRKSQGLGEIPWENLEKILEILET